MKEILINKIKDKSALIGVIGLGYAGLPIALRFAENNCNVLGIDIDEKKIEILRLKKNPFVHMDSIEVEAALNKKFEATSDFSKSKKCDVLILCLPTPINSEKKPNLSYIENTMNSIKEFFRKGQALILESTTYPGTTEELIMPYIEDEGFIIGNDFFLGYSPEREDPGNKNYNTKTIPKVCSGVTKNCSEIVSAIYLNAVDEVVNVSSPGTAEMSKLLENIYRSVNIGLVNEMKIIADEMQIDIHEVINAAATKPFGFTAFYPGPGLGGHCIPVDPFYLSWKAKQLGLDTKFIELSGEVNRKMPYWVFSKIEEFYIENNKNFSDLSILVLGLSYKKNIDDLRESPSLTLMEITKGLGFKVAFSDPFIKYFPPMRDHDFNLKSTVLTKENLETFDVVILSTDHDDFDYDLIQKHSKILVDTRGVYKKNYKNLIRA